jgi:hypothetical protein
MRSVILRNRKDFDVIYTIQFINKYARRFFHEEGYLQALENKMCAHAQTMVDLEDWEEPAVGEQSQINEPQKSPVPPKAKEAENLDSLVRAIEEDQPSLKDKQNVFMCMQDVWYIKFKGKRTVLKNLKGLQIIATLIQSPYKSLSNVGLASKNPKNALESINPRMEADVNLPYEVRANVESEVNRLLEDKQKRISLNKDESIEDIDRSIGLIRDTLTKVYGAELLILETEEGQKASIKARKIKLPKELEDARKNVGSLLVSSYNLILKPMPDLESYLRQCISTKSRFAIYEPHKSQTDKSIKWDVCW